MVKNANGDLSKTPRFSKLGVFFIAQSVFKLPLSMRLLVWVIGVKPYKIVFEKDQTAKQTIFCAFHSIRPVHLLNHNTY